MKRRDCITLLAAAMTGWPLTAGAQSGDNRVRRIGVLMAGYGRRAEAYVVSFGESLDALGWHEGRNLRTELRWGRGQQTLYDQYAAELVALSPELIVAQYTPPVAALRRQTSTVPIVFVFVNDPVGQGFVQTLARPGGNVTGFTTSDPAIAGKWLAMLTQLTPPISRVAALYNPETTALADQQLHAIKEAAGPLGIPVQAAPFRDRAEIEAIMAVMGREERSGLIVLGGDISSGIHSDAIMTAAAREHVPTVYSSRAFPREGGLMSYGAHVDDLFRSAASYVDRILRGAKPGDLPVQYPTKYETVINLKTARELGVTFSPSLLSNADEVIE